MLGILLLVLMFIFALTVIAAIFQLFGWALKSMGVVGTLLVIVLILWLMNKN